MRGLVIAFAACAAACGSAATTTTPATKPDPKTATPGGLPDEQPHTPVDPIAALAPVEDRPVSWVTPGPVQLELGGSGIESPGGTRPIEVAIIDRQGGSIRAAVRLPHARFSVWTARSRLFGVLTREASVTTPGAVNPHKTKVSAKIFAGARVTRLARSKGRTQIRYTGAFEIETWVTDDWLADAGANRPRPPRMFGGRRSTMLVPGQIIRTEPRWGNNQLAVANNVPMIETLQETADGWFEVTYTDGDVLVHGFTSRRQPPGAVHRPRDPDAPPPLITPNAKVASGTCLFSKKSGDRIGYIVGETDVQLDDLGGGWWTLAVDTPWGPLPFVAKGPSASALTPCAPMGSVPAPASP